VQGKYIFLNNGAVLRDICLSGGQYVVGELPQHKKGDGMCFFTTLPLLLIYFFELKAVLHPLFYTPMHFHKAFVALA